MPIDLSAISTRTPLSNASFKAYNRDEQYLYPKLFPDKVVDRTLTSIYQYDDQILRLYETKSTTDAEASLIDWDAFRTSITLEEHKIKAKINPHEMANADAAVAAFDVDAAQSTGAAISIRKEHLAATLATTSSNFPSDLTSAISTGVRWNEAGGDPEANAMTAHAAIELRTGQKANALAFSSDAWRALRQSPSFRDRVKFTNASGVVTTEAAMRLFDVEYLFIGSARYQSTRIGGTSNMTKFWADNALFFVYNPSIGLRDMGFGASYFRNKVVTRQYEDPRTGGVDGLVRYVETACEYKLAAGFVVSSSDADFGAGYLFRTIYT